MFQIKNFTDNDDIRIINQLGPFQVIEYQRDLSVMPGNAQQAYYSSLMNVRKRQVLCDLSVSPVTGSGWRNAVDGRQRQRHHRHQRRRRPVRQGTARQGHR